MEILIGGDVYLGNKSIEEMAKSDPSKIWGDSKSVFSAVNFSILNLESPLTNSKNKIKKTGPNIKASPETINLLNAVKIDLVTLANNHINDFGSEGIRDTLEICKTNEIDTVGAELSLKKAKKTYYKDIDGKRIAILNFAENEWSSAKKDQGGANPMNLIDNIQQINEAKAKADYVLVIVHGGHEHYKYPSPRMVKQYRFYAEQGASAIVGHHTHCVSGYENYNGVPIFYSIGNLIFPSTGNDEKWYKGLLVKLKFKENVSFDLIPYFQGKENSPEIKLMREEDARVFLNEISVVNEAIANENILLKKWEYFVLKESNVRLMQLMSKSNIFYRVLNKLNLIQLVIPNKKLRLLLNLIRCEAHRDLSIETMESIIRDK